MVTIALNSKAMLFYVAMNYRDYKKLYAGGIYHVFNRGNGKNDIFLERADYDAFIHRVRIILAEPDVKCRCQVKPLPEKSFSMFAYCLMPNHFHLLIKQETPEIPLSKFMSKLMTSYSKYFNTKYDRVGHLFQDCYKAIEIVDDGQFISTNSYIHNNPDVDAESYPYSNLHSLINPDTKLVSINCDNEMILAHFTNDSSKYLMHLKAMSKNS